MQSLLKISQQTAWQILGKIVTSLSTFIILGLVARNYGEEGTGIFTLALTYLAIFYLLSDFGFNAHVLKKVTGYPSTGLGAGRLQVTDEWQKLLGTRIVWSGVLVALAVGLLPFWPFATEEFSQSVIFGSLAIIGAGVFVTCNLIFQSKLRYDLSVLASSVGTLFSLMVFAALIMQRFPTPFLLLAHLLGWMVVALLALILNRRISKTISPIFDKQYMIGLFKDSWPIAATLALNVVYFRADSFMISYFRSNSEVGIYNVAYSVFQSALVLPTFILNAYYPLMLRSFSGIKLIGLGLLGLASMGTLLTIILSPSIINILTGEGFMGSTQSLKILSLGFPAYYLSALFMWIFISKGGYSKMLIIYALGLVFNLVLNLLYIPKFSFIAASWITVVSEYLILAMLAVVLWRNR